MKTRQPKDLKVLIQPFLQPAVVFAAISLLMFAQPGQSQDDVAELTNAPGTRRAVVLVGIPGDAAHEELFRATTESLCRWLTEGPGFSADSVTVLFGGSQSRPSGAHRAAKEDVKKVLDEIVTEVQSDDTLWLFVLGHANHDGHRAWFHLPGPDIHDVELAEWCARIECREQIFWLTHACSGSFLKPLSRPGRIVISATTADNEVNETEFPHALVDVVQRDGVAIDPGVNRQITVAELFQAIVSEVNAKFAADSRIPTEHAQLDDNGDGRGTEAPDLVPILESPGEAGRSSAHRDGAAAARIVLSRCSQTEADEPASMNQESAIPLSPEVTP